MRIKLDVAEPRDFELQGSKTITGSLVPELSGSRVLERDDLKSTVIQAPGSDTGEVKKKEEREYWFVVDFDAPAVSGDLRFSSLLMTPRYRVKKTPEEMLEKGEDLVVNGIWRKDGERWDKQSIDKAQEGQIEVEGILVARATRAE